MKFLLYFRPNGDRVWVNPDDFISLIKTESTAFIKYRLDSEHYYTDEVDKQHGVQIITENVRI